MTTKQEALDLLPHAVNLNGGFADSKGYCPDIFLCKMLLFNPPSFSFYVTATGYFWTSIIQLITTLVSYQPVTAPQASFFRTHNTRITLNFAI
jgi:hypothetical protein